jgi:hypothetical protein
MRLRASSAALTLVLIAACGKGGAKDAGGSGAGSGTGADAGSGGGAGSGGEGAGGATQGGLTARITATPDTGDGPLAVTLSGCTSTADSGEIVLYTWDFGDGTTGTGPVVQHVFSQGNPQVSLTITGSTQASASASKALAVTGPSARNLVTDPSKHPRLYFDAGHLAELESGIAATPILGTAGYKNSFVAGFLLDQSAAWESAHWYLTNGACTNLMGSAFTSTNSDPVGNSREISDCVTTLAAGAALETDAATATSFANAAIAAMVHMADVWPQTGVNDNAGFGRWDCGACSTGGSNLNNGELLYAVATSYDLLYGKMSAQDRTDVTNLLLREARFAYQASQDPTTWWNTGGGNNWRAVVHGGLGVAALALQGEAGLATGEAATWIARSVSQIEGYLDNNYDADGANYEDAAHFGYGLNFATQFFFALRNVNGEDHFDYKGQILQKAARYRVFATEANFDGIMPNDEASPDGTTYAAELLLASAYRDGFVQWAWDRVSGKGRPAANTFPFKVGGNGDQSQLMETALDYDPTVPVESPAGRLPLGRVYPTFGRALFRSDWEDPNGLSLAVESGVYGSHGHPNQGHFFITGYGATLLTHKSAGGGSGDFNVVRVDGKDQVVPSGSITVNSLLSTTDAALVAPLVDHVRFDTKAAYVAPLDHAYRDFLFVLPAGTAGGYALVLDDLGAAASHTYATELHFASGLTTLQSKGAGHYQASGGGASIDAFLIEPSGAKESTTDGLAISATGTGATFATLLYPTDTAHPLPAIQPVTAGAASGFTVGADTVLSNPTGKPFTQGTLASDGIVVLARGAAPAFGLVGLYGGTTLSVGGATWLSATAPVDAVLTTAADGVHVWVSGAAGSKVDLKVLVAGTGGVVVSIDDKLSAFATPDAAGLVTVPGLDVSSAHEVLIGSASTTPAGCN